MRSRRHFLQVSSLTAILTAKWYPAWSRTLSIKNTGWLEVRQLKGKVIYHRKDKVQQLAWTGLRLWQVGQALESQSKAEAVLALDQGLGYVYVGENTEFSIKNLHTTANGGRVTILNVKQGQVRLKVRSMSNPSSRLEIHTPAGISGVRGTEFGVVVQPSGKTGIATLSGQVDAIARSTVVPIKKEQQSLTIPTEPPQPAVPLRDDPSLILQHTLLEQTSIEGKGVRLIGQTDPVNVLLVEDQPQDTDRNGKFNLFIATNDAPVLKLRVVTPLGTQRRYELPLR